MGEAKRRKLAGNTGPKSRYRKTRKMTNKQISQAADEMLVQFVMQAMIKSQSPLILRR